MMETGFLDRSINVKGIDHKYVVYVPNHAIADAAMPAILFLHGKGESGTDGMYPLYHGVPRMIVKHREEWPFLVICPQKPHEDDEWFDLKEMVSSILLATDTEFTIDPQRRYITGLSQGGRGTLRLAKQLTWKFAAAAAVCGWSSDPAATAAELAGLPLWLFHGELDTVVPPSGSKDVFAELQSLGESPRLTIYPDLAHNCWDRAYESEGLPEWFLSHSPPT